MKNIFVIIFITLILSNCSSEISHEKKGKREILPSPEKYEHDGYSQIPDSVKPIFLPDTSIGKIALINSENIELIFGKGVMDKLTELEDEYKLPHSSTLSQDLSQKLTIYFHPGSSKNKFSEFKVEYNHNSNRSIDNNNSLKMVFNTESNIELGMTIGDLKAIKGDPISISNESTSIYHYQIKDFKNSEFLKKYNMPSYYANYEFENGYLVEFKFGFEYP